MTVGQTGVRGVLLCTSTTHPVNANVGDRIYETDTGAELIWVGPTDGWRPPWNLPWGYITSALTTADQTGITTTVDITSASVVFTVPANRRTKIAWVVQALHPTDNGLIDVFVTDGSNVLQTGSEFNVDIAGANGLNVDGGFIVQALAAGTYTRKLRAAGNGVGGQIRGASQPGIILVEDIGPNGNPS